MGAILTRIRRVRRGAGRWAGLLAALLAVLVLARADQRMKQAPHAGFLPPDVAWSAAATDFPAFLDGLNRTGAAATLRENWPAPLDEAALRVRLETGIRPTPARWRVWLGRALLAGELNGARGFCVKPGLAARAAHRVNRFAGGAADGMVCRYGTFFYAWREGYLIVSEDPGYVRAALDAPPVEWPSGLDTGAVQARWPGKGDATLTVRGAAGIPFEGSVPWDVKSSAPSTARGVAWPENPMLAVSASDTAHLRLLAGLLWAAASHAPGWAESNLLPAAVSAGTRVLEAWCLDALPEDWSADIAGCSMALFPGTATAAVPLPEAAVVLRPARADAAHPLAVLDSAGLARPYVWNGLEGALVPWLGTEHTLCLLGMDHGWVAATNPDLMDRLAGASWPAGAPRADVSVEADWAQVGALAQALLRYAAQHGLVPGMDARDAESRLLPAVQALAELGRLRVDGRSVDGCLQFQGLLALEAAP